MANLDSVLKSRDITLAKKSRMVQAMVGKGDKRFEVFAGSDEP